MAVEPCTNILPHQPHHRSGTDNCPGRAVPAWDAEAPDRDRYFAPAPRPVESREDRMAFATNNPTPTAPRTHVTDGEVADLTRRAETAEQQLETPG
ncbi:hypothetical protein [Rhizomonospora bruguierae]|uniref:hypothetical protein n=1 Tax=Rhizomonospora bruguierae TaxID=1581705 RepID=UPI001BCFE0C5|nr:hypothetical protein [Micromonospora sp. NBRC 107566]